MAALLKIILVFVLVVRLLKLNWNLGGVMLIGAAALGLLMGLSPSAILSVAWKSSIQPATISLIVALALIMVLEDHRMVMAMMPAIIGVLPSAGGAYFSAPMVAAGAEGSPASPERKSFINYWFRHVWEYVSPLYPGFILTAAVAHVPMSAIFRYQIAFPLAVLATGAAFAFKGMGAGEPVAARRRAHEDVASLFVSFSPILVVMLLVMVLKVDIAVAMVAVVAGLFLYFRYMPAKIWATLKESLSFKTLLLVLGVEIFGGIMKGSGAVDTLPQFFRSEGVPVVLILFIVPFLVGLITGITSGFAGVMFSPVHLCLVLTKDYFKAELFAIFRIMLVPELIVLAVAAGQMMLFK